MNICCIDATRSGEKPGQLLPRLVGTHEGLANEEGVDRPGAHQRDIIRRQPLPGYQLFLEVEIGGRSLLAFEPSPSCGKPVDSVVPSGTRRHVPTGTRLSCQQEPKPGLSPSPATKNRAPNLESNKESNFLLRARDVENLIHEAASALDATPKSRRHSARQTRPDAPQLPLDDHSGGKP